VLSPLSDREMADWLDCVKEVRTKVREYVTYTTTVGHG
jgi:hypothetical protein